MLGDATLHFIVAFDSPWSPEEIAKAYKHLASLGFTLVRTSDEPQDFYKKLYQTSRLVPPAKSRFFPATLEFDLRKKDTPIPLGIPRLLVEKPCQLLISFHQWGVATVRVSYRLGKTIASQDYIRSFLPSVRDEHLSRIESFYFGPVSDALRKALPHGSRRSPPSSGHIERYSCLVVPRLNPPFLPWKQNPDYCKLLAGVARGSVVWEHYDRMWAIEYVNHEDLSINEDELLILGHETLLFYNPRCLDGARKYVEQVIEVVELTKSVEAACDLAWEWLVENVQSVKEAISTYQNKMQQPWILGIFRRRPEIGLIQKFLLQMSRKFLTLKQGMAIEAYPHIEHAKLVVDHCFTRFRIREGIDQLSTTTSEVTPQLGQILYSESSRVLLLLTCVLVGLTIVLVVLTIVLVCKGVIPVSGPLSNSSALLAVSLGYWDACLRGRWA